MNDELRLETQFDQCVQSPIGNTMSNVGRPLLPSKPVLQPVSEYNAH